VSTPSGSVPACASALCLHCHPGARRGGLLRGRPQAPHAGERLIWCMGSLFVSVMGGALLRRALHRCRVPGCPPLLRSCTPPTIHVLVGMAGACFSWSFPCVARRLQGLSGAGMAGFCGVGGAYFYIGASAQFWGVRDRWSGSCSQHLVIFLLVWAYRQCWLSFTAIGIRVQCTHGLIRVQCTNGLSNPRGVASTQLINL